MKSKSLGSPWVAPCGGGGGGGGSQLTIDNDKCITATRPIARKTLVPEFANSRCDSNSSPIIVDSTIKREHDSLKVDTTGVVHT